MPGTVIAAKTACAFGVAAAWVALTAKVGQRSGRWGGVVAALPSVTAFSLLFIAWTQGGAAAGRTAAPLPAGIGACAVAAMVYVRLARRSGVAASLAGSALAWAAVMLPVFLAAEARSLPAADAIGLVCIGASALLLPSAAKATGSGRRKVRGLLLKAALSGAVVASAVVAARILGPLAGAVVASFPVILWTALMVFHADLGPAALSGMARGFMTGLLGGVVFANTGHLLFPVLGVLPAFAAAYGACLVAVGAIVFLTGS